MIKIVKLAEADFLFTLRKLHKALNVLADDFAYRHQFRTARIKNDRPRRKRLFAIRERVKGDNRLLLALSRLKLKLYFNGIVSQIMKFADGDFFLLDLLLNRLGERVGRLAPRKFGNDKFILIFLLDLRTDLNLS